MNTYELADELLRDNTQLTVKAANILRQQADRIAELEKQTKQTPDGLIDPKSYYIGYADGKKAPQTKPLSDEEIMDIAEQSDYSPVEIEMGYEYEIRIARSIEERHGIK